MPLGGQCGLTSSARIENAILCSNVRIGEKATIKDCEFGPGFEAQPSCEWTIMLCNIV